MRATLKKWIFIRVYKSIVILLVPLNSYLIQSSWICFIPYSPDRSTLEMCCLLHK